MSKIILACSSLVKDIAAAQQKMRTNYPLLCVNRKYHANPAKMRQQLIQALASLEPQVDTVLVAMGFCGGSWADIVTDRRIVIPCVDDCITLLLHTDNKRCVNLKQPGHFYFREPDAGRVSLEAMQQGLCDRVGEKRGKALLQQWFQNYTHIDIIDTGTYDSYAPAHLAQIAKDAELVGCQVEHVAGSNLLLEKLVSGRWDEQFLVIEPGRPLSCNDFS